MIRIIKATTRKLGEFIRTTTVEKIEKIKRIKRIKKTKKVKMLFMYFFYPWVLCFVAPFLNIGIAFADFNNFQEDLNYANAMRGQVQQQGANFDPYTTFGADYNPDPAQTKYFNNVTQSSDNGLKTDAAKDVSQDPAGTMVDDSFKTRPVYHVDSNSDAMQKSRLIQNDSYDISHGISDKYVDCSANQECKTVYTENSCNEETRYVTRNCTKYPKITIVDQSYVETQTYSGSIAPKDRYSGVFTLPVSGTITSFDITLKGSSDDTWRCKNTYSAYLNTNGGNYYISSQRSGCGEGLGDMSYHNHNMIVPSTAGSPITFSFQGGPAYGNWGWARYNLTIQAQLHRKVAQIDWIQNCDGNLSGEICTDKSTVCTIPGSTRYFDGVPVTLDCWNYNIVQQCGAKTDDSCQNLRDKGCSQTSSACRIMLGDTCAVQDETYSCPVKKCEATSGIVCGGDFFCMNGDCSNHTPVQNNNFGKDASELAAVSSAATDVENQNVPDPRIFTGTSMECSIDMLGTKDCCKDSGWLNGNIMGCSDDEKKLGIAKEKGLTLAIGDGDNEYCHNKVAGVCTAKHKVYCAFSDKLSRVVQQQGRRVQLGISFGHVDGDSAHPDCRGLTVDEVQRIDFDKIDFNDVINDITSHVSLPDNSKIQQNVKQNVQNFYDQNKAHN